MMEQETDSKRRCVRVDKKTDSSTDEASNFPTHKKHNNLAKEERPVLVCHQWDWSKTEKEKMEKEPAENWGSSGSAVSSTYSAQLLQEIVSVCQSANREVEVVNHPISSSATLIHLLQQAQIKRQSGYRYPRGSHGFYFLWPTQFYDGPGNTTGCYAGGFVECDALLALMRFNENELGLHTGFPHPAAVYQDLVSKRWVPRMCTIPKFQIPPTVTITRADVKKHGYTVAACNALETLSTLKADGASHTVVKLGYSWESLDVISTVPTVSAIADTVEHLFEQQGCFADVALLQEKISADCELRLFVINGEIKHRYYARYDKCDAITGRFENWITLPRDEAQVQWFSNDAAAIEMAEHLGNELALLWYSHLCEQQPSIPAFRCDVLIRRDGDGRALANTLELTELGFSMWAWKDGAHTVFKAVAQQIVSKMPPQL
eukprot:m.197227 g.197227  ORF g.197227 m.197227 type:complete len:433 (-) comp32654_c0_seq1:35-1333(-)